MSETPTVSVAMALYNTERYLAQAVESILTQTFADVELVIIDDGSTDCSLKILNYYAQRDHRIRLVSRDNRGISATRNELLSMAKGEFIAVMDSDDVALPDRLARQVEFLRDHPEVLCVGSAQQWIDEAGRFLWLHPEPTENQVIQEKLLVGHTCINHSSAMFRRSAALQIGGYDESLSQAEDLDLFLRLGEIGLLANLPDALIQYRQHQNSISERNHLEHLELTRKVCELAWQRRKLAEMTFDARPWRPIDRASRCRVFIQYGWLFFHRGNRSAALLYGIQAIKTLPLVREGWFLLVCALLKPKISQFLHD